MSEARTTGEAEAFAQLLRELKDRSGLSYGTLAKRLHMSTSTLHRYCNGSAVPVDYAPVERLARVCRATPQELVELHRRWILADAARGRRVEDGSAGANGSGDKASWAGANGSADSDSSVGVNRSADPSTSAAHSASAAVPTVLPGPGSAPSPTLAAANPVDEADEPVVVDLPGAFAPPSRLDRLRRRRTVLVSSVVVAAALGTAVITVPPLFGGHADNVVEGRATTAAADTADATEPSADPSPVEKKHKPSASASPSPTRSVGAGSGSSKGDGRRSGASPVVGDATGGVPLAVAVRPYIYDNPCSQHFLVNSDPEQVGPPAMTEQDAPRWAAAYGAVASGDQRVALTVQGTGAQTVVLEALHVRFLAKDAPLAWNDYSMGVGCGGGVDTKSFDVDLDNGSPTVTVKNGQRDFPYKVSESDPEVFYVTAHTKAHDVRWDLSLDWTSGNRHGTVHIDNAGTPFRTSADVDRPGYDYPLGGGEWIERES